MTALPKFSVVVTGYNQAAVIKRALLSVLNQDYQGEIEYIFSDDCSSDQTFQIMEETAASYRGRHPIRLNRNETNLNIGAHIEKLYGMASHPWVIRMDGDDISLPFRCSMIAQAIAQFPNSRYIVSDVQLFSSDSLASSILPTPSCQAGDKLDAVIVNDTDREIYLGTTSAILKEKRYACSELNLKEDALQAQYAWFHQGLVRINNKLILYHEHGDNASRVNTNVKNRNLKTFYQGLEKHKAIITKSIEAQKKMIDISLQYLSETSDIDHGRKEQIVKNVEKREQEIRLLEFDRGWTHMNLVQKLNHFSELRKSPWKILPLPVYARLLCLREKLK